MATERIDSIIDIPAVQAEYEKLTEYLDNLVASMEKVANSKIGAASQAQGIAATQAAVQELTQSTAQLAGQQEKLVTQAQTIVNTAKQQISSNEQVAAAVRQHSGSIEENIRLQIQFTKQLSDNKQMQKDLQTAFNESKIGATAFGQAQVTLNKQQLELKSTISGLNSTLKQQTQENQAAGTSYQQLSAQLTQLRSAYRGLSEAERSSEGGQGLKAQITQLDQALKSIDAEMGIHVRHVGNYTGALKTLESGLSEAQASLQRYIETGQQNTAAGQQAQAEVDVFTQLLAQQEKGFTSLSREIMATGKALETMAEQGLQGTETFKRLEQQFVEGRRELNEFRKNQQLLTSEAPKLQALTLAAKGLAGMYALGAGTAALFANGNEKVEKELNKMVAVMTVLQGLHEVHELLEKRTAIATIATGIAQGFKNFVLTGSIKAQEAATAAEAANVVVQEEDVVATEADIAAKEAQVAATESVTVATNTATGSMVALRIALLATGIGAILLLISSAAAAMNVFGKTAKELAKESEDLAEAEKAVNETIIKQIETLNNADQAYKKYYENQLALSSAAGQNQYQQLALKKKIAEQEREDAQNTLDTLQAQFGKEGELLSNLETMQEKKRLALEINKKALEDGDKMAQTTSKNLIDMYGKQEEAAKEAYDAVHKAHDDLYAAIQKDGQIDLETQRLSNEEQRKLALTTAKIAAEARISANDRVLENEKSTLAQRLAANQSNLRQQIAIIQAEKREKESEPGITLRGREIAEREANAAIAKDRADTAEKNRKLNLEYWKRDQAAYMEISKQNLEFASSANAEIAADTGRTLQERLFAYKAYEAEQKALIDQERDYKLLTEGLTVAQVEAIEAEHQAKLGKLRQDGMEQDKKFRREAIDTTDSQGQNQVSQNYNADVANLTQSLERKMISQKKYEEERKRLQEGYEMDQLRVEMETTKALIALTADGTKERADLEKKLADQNIQMSDLQAKKKKQDLDKTSGEVEKWVKLEQTAAKHVQEIVDATFTRRLNQIERLEEANTKAKDREITEINASSLSSQEKAAKLIQIEEQAKVTQDRLDKERRDTQLRQAKFDRDAQVLEIIGNSLVASWKVGWPQGIPIAIEGAVQAAILAAKPLPRFEGGTESSPAGWALTDEKGPEIYRRPSGKVFLGNDRPTLRYLEAGTEIIPYQGDTLNKILYNQMIQGTAAIIMPPKNDETGRKIDRLTRAIEDQTDRLEKAYRQVKPPRLVIKQDLKNRYVP